MELEQKGRKIAILENGDIQAFVYQSTMCKEVTVEVPDEYLTEEIFNEAQQNRFKVVDGAVVKKTDEELKNQPRYTEYLTECRKARYEKETDDQKEKVIEILAKESKDPIVMEWLAKKDKIRAEVI